MVEDACLLGQYSHSTSAIVSSTVLVPMVPKSSYCVVQPSFIGKLREQVKLTLIYFHKHSTRFTCGNFWSARSLQPIDIMNITFCIISLIYPRVWPTTRGNGICMRPTVPGVVPAETQETPEEVVKRIIMQPCKFINKEQSQPSLAPSLLFMLQINQGLHK